MGANRNASWGVEVHREDGDVSSPLGDENAC